MLYIFEGCALDTDRRELRRGDSVVAVQPQVFDLLEFLISNRDRVVSKDDILAAVWSGRIVSDSTLTSRINAARTALGDNGENQRLIRTLPRKGIRFVGAVREEQKATDAAATDAPIVAAQPPQFEAASKERPSAAERCQLTVASCELLVGGDTARMDPEDLRDVVRAFRRCVEETARRHNGHAASTIGYTILIYFGFPVAHEHDAEQAVRAGLELIAAVATLASPFPLQARVGIATGLVVTGDLIESREAPERGIVGETPNLAARLQSIAEANTVVVAEGTRRLLGNLFELLDLGTRDIKGAAGSVRAWSALRASSVASRFEAMRGSGLSALVGREEESQLLLRRWSRAITGEGQVVLLAGEAGIGKSRLTAAFIESLADESHARLRYFCSPQHVDSAAHPIIDQMERAAGLAHSDKPQAKLEKLDALLAQTSTSPEDAALLAEMLSLPNDGRYPALDLTPQQRRHKTLAALLGQIEALARTRPVLMIFEDAHWSDPTSLELAGQVVDKVAKLRVLLIVTFRPEFHPPWIGRPHVTALTINRLTPGEAGALIEMVAGDKVLRENLRRGIVEHTDGIPLFVEEMTKAVLEAESESGAQWTAPAIALPALAVPASLHASLLARLDRLGAPKETAQIGAAIGREFSHALLAAVVSKPEPELESALDRLVAAGLLFRQGMPPHASYLFKHALVRDAAYGTLLREPRRALHARIADVLECQFAEMAESQPELLARHYTEAGLTAKAAALWGKAGQRSLDRSALVEAATQLTRALDLLAALPATPALRREQIKLQVALITPLIHVKGFAAPETKAAAERALLLIRQAETLGETPEDPLLLFSVLYGFWAANLVAFNGDALRDFAARFLAIAEQQGATIPLMIGNRLMGTSLLCTGETAQGRSHLDRAIALYDPAEHRRLATRFGQDSRVSILCYRSWALWMLGYPEAALADATQALGDAREIGQAATLMNTLALTSLIHIFCGNYAAAEAQSDETAALADEKGAVLWQAFATMNRGCVFALRGKALDAVTTIGSGIAGWRSTGAKVLLPLNLSILAGAHAQLGQFDDARRCIGDAMTAVKATKETLFEAEIHRVAGETALAAEPDQATAEAHFERALMIAQVQQAKSWELRAATSMARLKRDQGKEGEARELLTPVYGWFTEGFDTLDLIEAKALLRALTV